MHPSLPFLFVLVRAQSSLLETITRRTATEEASEEKNEKRQKHGKAKRAAAAAAAVKTDKSIFLR